MYERFTLIDESTVGDHYYLNSSDKCAFFGEYTARKGFAHSRTNQLILNFKKGLERRNLQDFPYKAQAIETVAQCLFRTIGNPENFTFVPVPPSKDRNNPLYDDRLTRVLRRYKELQPSVDFRELVFQSTSTNPSHDSEDRLSPDTLRSIYQIDQSLVINVRPAIAIFDDMLTTGSHFKAMQSVLSELYPNHQIVGIFIARRVPEALDPILVFSDLSC